MVPQKASQDVLFENEQLRLSFDPSISCLIKEWKVNVKQEEFRTMIMRLLMTIVQARMKYLEKKVNLIADVSKLGPEVFSPETIQWLDENVHRIYLLNKMERKAFVKSDDQLTNLTLLNYISQTNSKSSLVMNVFDTMEEARIWASS